MKRMIILLTAFVSLSATAQNRIDLSGRWDFAQGEQPTYGDHIMLPGSMLTNDKGDIVTTKTQWVSSLYDSSFFFNPYMEKYRQAGNMKFPFFLTPKKHYVGYAWYKRTVNIPKSWKKRRVLLFLERPHIETSIYVNGLLAGRDSSLSVPHEFDITDQVQFGKDNEISIRVYNGIENVCVGQDSHSVTDQTQGDWNGIAGRIELQSRPRRYIQNVMVFPDIKNRQANIKICIAGGDTITDVMQFGDDMQLWDEFNPHLYTYTATYQGDTVRTQFGMREITIEGRQFYLNGNPIWLRGTVENCCFPLTGYPPCDEESWLRIFKKCKAYGLNHMRFHSYCPPEAAFCAADKVGFYLQPEGPSWPNHGVKLRRGMTIDRYLLEETQRMVEKYGNHPSFTMLAAGNEPAGDWVSWVGDFVDYWHKTGDNRRVYCGASVGGGWAFDPKSDYHVKGGARGLDWDRHAPQSADDFYNGIIRFTQKGSKPVTFDINEPLVCHEMGQWCAFPDFKEIPQYTGVYKAGNFEIFRDLLADNVAGAPADSKAVADMGERFLQASGKLQLLSYKYDIERNLRTKDYAGFQLLGLNDYSGQGSALVGVLNVFWREKGYCTDDDWREFCAPVVPLALFPKFVYENTDTLRVPLKLYNAFKEMKDMHIYQTITNASDNAREHYVRKTFSELPLGKDLSLGEIVLPLDKFTAPTKLTLRVDVGSTGFTNHWDFWVYPKEVAQTQKKSKAKTIEPLIVDTLSKEAIDVLSKGGTVLLTAAGKVTMGDDIKQSYLPVFWNTSWFKMRPPHTTGVSIDKNHPLFKHFPTEDWGTLNWWELINKAQVMNLSRIDKSYQSPVQPIDTWHVSRKLGMLLEAQVLNGRVLMTTMDIAHDLDHRPVARQMRKAILQYMQSNDFAPTLQLSPEKIREFYTMHAPTVDMFTHDSPDELKPKLK